MGEGLRDRRRLRTRREIERAALRLTQRLGFDRVTVDLISAEAGVSPRTFFNYFPSKEAAVVLAPPAELSGPLVTELVAGGDTRPQQVLADLTRLLVRDLAENPLRREEMKAVVMLARDHPALLASLLARFDDFERSIAAAVGRRLGQRPEDEVPTLIAALALTAIRAGVGHWAREESRGDEDDVFLPHVERSVELLRTLLRS